MGKVLELSNEEIAIKPTPLINDGDKERWVTIKGQKVKIDDDGNIVAGNPKVMGGGVKFTTNKKENIKLVTDRIKELGFDAYTESESGRAVNSRFPALASQSQNRIFINPKSNFWKDPEGEQKRSYESGKLSSPDPMHVINHEIAHLKFDAPDNFLSNTERDVIKKEVSEYAATNPKEFVSEAYAGIEYGKEYSPEVMRLYERYKKDRDVPKKRELPEHLKKLMEKQNASSDYPKFYYTRHMQAGLCGYEDETILVDTDAVTKLGTTFKGKPIYIQHQDVKLDTLKEDAVGYVQNTFMGVDGWLWSEIMITDDEGHDVILNKGWAVSNAYVPTQWGDAGTKHNLPYDREVLAGEFTHLALVPNPRYEGAKIYTPEQYQARNTQLVNSLATTQPPKKGFIMKFWKKEEVSDASTADFVEYTNDKGETVTKSVEEMKNALEAEAKQAEIQAKKVLVNGKQMTVAELTAAYEKLNAKKNEGKEEEKDNESDEDEKENEDDESDMENESDKDEKENEDDEDKGEKKNAKKDHFKEMKNAHNTPMGAIRIETTPTKLARGNSMYGSGR